MIGNRLFLTAAILGCTTATVATAQIVITTNGTPATITTNPSPTAAPRSLMDGRRLVFTMNFSVNVPTPQLNTTADVTGAMSTASGTLYEVLNRQCDVLTQSFKGTCRLIQMNVGGNVGTRSQNGPLTVTANANGTFEIEAEALPQAPPPPH